MKPEIKKRWVAALRCGTYKQGQGKLRYITQDLELKYCCLGVLCDIVKDELNLQWNDYNKICGTDTYLPSIICEYTGVRPFGHYEEIFGGPDLATHNDSGKSFEEIAQVIEEKF